MKQISSHHWLTVIALGLLILGSALGQRYPWHIDEVRYVGVAMEMLQDNQWLIPHRASEIYADKPPVYFWLLAGAIQLTDSVRWGFLLPGILAGIATLLLVYDLGTRWWNRNVGLCSAILLLASYQFWRITTSAHIDSVLVFLTTLGIYGFARHLRSGKDTAWFFTGFAAVAAGILSKGVGFLPLLMFVPFAYAHYRKHILTSVPARQWLTGIILMLVMLLCWLLPLVLRADSNLEVRNYLDNILLRQTGKRFSEAWQHREPFWFFFTNIPKYWAPLSFLLPWLVPTWWRRIRRHDTRYILLLSWVALVLLFFSLSSGKRELYILPALPATALAAAPATLLLIRQRWIQRLAITATWLLIGATVAAAVVRTANLLPQSRIATWPVDAGWALLFIGALIPIVATVFRNRANPVLVSLAAYGLLVVFYHRVLLPLLDDGMSGRESMHALCASVAPAALALIEWDERHWLYSRAPLRHNGIGADHELSLCSLVDANLRWLMSTRLASERGIPASQAFTLQRKKIFVAVPPADTTHCATHNEFHYRFEWSEKSLALMDR